jgi:hypothetical protein
LPEKDEVNNQAISGTEVYITRYCIIYAGHGVVGMAKWRVLAADLVARVWKARIAYGFLLGVLSENGHLENLEGCESIALT